MAKASTNPLFTRQEKRRGRVARAARRRHSSLKHRVKGYARFKLGPIFGIPLSRNLLTGKGARPSSRREAHRTQKPPAGTLTSSVRRDVIEALRGQGYSKSVAEKMAPAAHSGDSFDSLFRRAMARNPGELIIFGNPSHVYTRKGIVKAYRAGNPIMGALVEGIGVGAGLGIFELAKKTFQRSTNPIPLAILQGLQFGAGEKVVEAATSGKSRRKKHGRKNPGSQGRAKQLFEDFHHRPSSGTYETQRSAKLRKDFTILGPLVAIGINAEKYDQRRAAMAKRVWEDWKVEQWDKLPHLAFLTGPQISHVKSILGDPDKYVKDCPHLASSPNGKQLYAITPDGVDLDLKMFDTDTTKDFIDLGEATFVVYIAKKPDEPLEWVHELGEEGGTRPRLMFDRLKREIFFIGGSYRVEAPGILN
jgi:hypothetical protein